MRDEGLVDSLQQTATQIPAAGGTILERVSVTQSCKTGLLYGMGWGGYGTFLLRPDCVPRRQQ